VKQPRLKQRRKRVVSLRSCWWLELFAGDAIVHERSSIGEKEPFHSKSALRLKACNRLISSVFGAGRLYEMAIGKNENKSRSRRVADCHF
jgi:hypothetical protein